MDDLDHRRKTKQPLEWAKCRQHLSKTPWIFLRENSFKMLVRGLFQCKMLRFQISIAGFVINRGNATAQEVIDLISMIQKRVKEKFGVELHT